MTSILLLTALSLICFFKVLTWGSWQLADLLYVGQVLYAAFVVYWLAHKKYHHLMWVPALALCALTSHYIHPQASLISFLLFAGAFQVHRKPFAILAAVTGACFLVHWMSYGTALNPVQALIISTILFCPLYLLKALPTFKSPLGIRETAILLITALAPIVGSGVTQQLVLFFSAIAGCCLLSLGFAAFHMDKNRRDLALKSTFAFAAIVLIAFPISVWVMQ